ncbi:MAG: glucokinase [Gammaproteobacteria bacterium]
MTTRLIGDIGGTNTRLALVDTGVDWRFLETSKNETFDSLEAIVEQYLKARGARPDVAAFAVAGPVRDGEATLTNRGWKISARALADRFGWEHCQVVNDFSGVALGIPALSLSDLEKAGGGERKAGKPVAILGPGTGLGVGGIVPYEGGERVLVTEGGHATLPAANERTAAIIGRLRARFGHVSIERVLSGQGLENVYRAIGELGGKQVETLSAAAIGRAAERGEYAAAVETMDVFFELLGAVAGDLALSYGAFGGVYIAGGIVPRYLEAFRASRFRKAFESKGRMSDYARAIPAFVILHEEVELLGLAASLDARKKGKPWPIV